MRHTFAKSTIAALCTFASGAACAQQSVNPPSVTAASSADGSHAYNAAAYSKVPQNLASLGYFEAEFLISGAASGYTYTQPNNTANDAVTVLPGGAVAYTNRILVRGPSNPSKFSGNVVVELLNDALTGDNVVQWVYAYPEFTRNGDIWIGLTSETQGLNALKKFAPTRYANLRWPGLSSASGCSSSQESGLIYDQITELGKLIREKSSVLNPNGVFNVKHVYLTSYSESSQILLTYNKVFDSQNPGLWDGYMVSSGGYRAKVNSCENQYTGLGRMTGPSSTTAAVVQTQTISETMQPLQYGLPGGVPTSGADSDTATNRYRYYDLAGASHVNNELVQAQPNSNDLAAAGALDVNQAAATNVCGDPSGSALSEYPNHFLYDALWDNLEQWVNGNVAPPHATKMDYANSVNGYPVGGVREPGVDAPLFSYIGGHKETKAPQYATPCSVTGYQTQIPYSQLQSSYGDVQGYDQHVELSAQRNNQARYLTGYDLTAIMNQPGIVAPGYQQTAN